jgi:hypothetical protein
MLEVIKVNIKSNIIQIKWLNLRMRQLHLFSMKSANIRNSWVITPAITELQNKSVINKVTSCASLAAVDLLTLRNMPRTNAKLATRRTKSELMVHIPSVLKTEWMTISV